MTKLLLLGNSFSDDMAMYMPEIAMEYNIDIDVHILGYPGCSINQHLDFISNNKNVYVHRTYDFINKKWLFEYNVKPVEIINKEKWDYIFIQQCSSLSGESGSISNVDELIALVRKNILSKDSKFAWHMTWPYPSFNEFEIFNNDFKRDPEAMYQGILDNVQKYIVNNKNISLIIPNGTAVMNLKTKQSERDIYRDPVHLSFHFGRFVASLVVMKKLFNLDYTNLIYRPFSMMDVNQKVCVAACDLATLNPFEVTKINVEE